MKMKLTRAMCSLLVLAVVASSVYGLVAAEADIQLSKLEITSEYTRVSGTCFEISEGLSFMGGGFVLDEAKLPFDGSFTLEAEHAPDDFELATDDKKSRLNLSGFADMFGLQSESYNSFSLKMQNGKFVFSGKHSGETGTYVTMKILDENGEIKAIGEKRSDETGSFYFEFYIRPGSYTFDLKAEELSGVSCGIVMPEINFGVDAEDFTEVVSELEGCAAELDGLREECRAKGLTTDYEDVNIEIIKKFIGYLYEENEAGYSDSVGQYYYALKKLYRQAKADMTAYLEGEKLPFDVPEYKTSNLSFEGENLFATADTETKSETRPVFFNGFGHFDTAKQDLEFFNSIGLNATQISLPSVAGCFQTEKAPDYWDMVRNGGSTAKFLEVSDESAEGKYSLMAQSDDFWQKGRILYISQKISASPNTTYNISFKSKGSSQNSESLMVCFDDVHTGTKYGVSPSSKWRVNSYEYTTKENENYINLSFVIVNKITGIYIDDVWNGAVHGRGAAVYWLWDRSDTTLPWSENSRYTHSNFALRPEETAAIT